jgi:hypothetical protein
LAPADVQHADPKYLKFADEMNEAKHAQHSEVYPVLEVCGKREGLGGGGGGGDGSMYRVVHMGM